MAEDVYAIPDLTKKVRYGRRERQQEMEERGEREERMVDIYVSADDLDPDPDPGTQQDAVQQNTTQAQHDGSDESKKNGSRAAAVCLGLLGVLCVILLAVITGLVIYNSDSCNLTKDQEQLQSRYDNITRQNDQIQSRYNNLTEQKDQLQSRYDNITKQIVQIQSSFDHIQSRYNNLTQQMDPIQSSFDHLQSRYNKLIERDDIKRILCEPRNFKFGGGVCYYISSWTRTWEQSREYCKEKQSDLMVINSKEKQDFVNTVVDRYRNVWLGLTDREEEGGWKWVDGTPLTTPTYWRPGEPNNSGDEDCVVLQGGGWVDISCSAPSYPICERVI